MQYEKLHATSIVAAVALASNRFVAYDGGYPSAAGGLKDVRGVSESSAVAGERVALVKSASFPVESSAAIAYGDYVKPATDGTGRAAVGTLTDSCGRALSVATAAGQLVEVELYRHVHA